MGYYITVNDTGGRYENVKNLSFAPEIDPVIATLHICEFSADIVANPQPSSGWRNKFVTLWEDQGRENATNTCIAGWYEVIEEQHLSDEVVHIRAQSLLGYLDRRTLAPLYFTEFGIGAPSLTPTQFVEKLFTDEPVNNVETSFEEGSLPISISGNIYDRTEYSDYLNNSYSWGYTADTTLNTGFCPQQTARERLHWFCQAYELKVIQFGIQSESGLCIAKLDDTPYAPSSGNPLLELNRTYMKPSVKRVSNYERCEISFYGDFTYSEHQGNDWEKYVIQEGWDDPESGMSQEEIAMYYRHYVSKHQVKPSANDNTAYITGNTMIRNTSSVSSTTRDFGFFGNNLKFCYWRNYEVELEYLQVKRDGTEDYVWPGDKVYFYTDPDTIYYGVVKSCECTFGNLMSSKLRISTDLKPVRTSKIELKMKCMLGDSSSYYKTFAAKSITAPAGYYNAHGLNPRALTVHIPKKVYVQGADRIVAFETSANETQELHDSLNNDIIYTQST